VIELNIPGQGTIQLNHLVCDVNGTLALDGRLIEGVPEILAILSDRLEIHLLTADTHGQQDQIDRELGLTAVRIPKGDEATAKSHFVSNLGAESVVAIGQGANDEEMLRAAQVGIGVLSDEGLAVKTVISADVLVPNINAALALLEQPMRLVATLRQ
jgi:P-type E1-E2 ATPase